MVSFEPFDVREWMLSMEFLFFSRKRPAVCQVDYIPRLGVQCRPLWDVSYRNPSRIQTMLMTTKRPRRKRRFARALERDVPRCTTKKTKRNERLCLLSFHLIWRCYVVMLARARTLSSYGVSYDMLLMRVSTHLFRLLPEETKHQGR